MTSESYAKYLDKSTFFRYLINNLTPWLGKNLKEIIHQYGVSGKYIDIGTEKEKYLKNILEISQNITAHLDDLFETTKYLSVDRKNIRNLYGELIKEEAYFKYQYDNFIMRITSSIDICGKVGNRVFNLKIEDKYCNWATFANYPSMKGSESSKKLLEFADYLENYRLLRHSKLHKGKTPANRFNKVIFWDSLNLGTSKIDPVLHEYTKMQLEDELKEINRVIDDVKRMTFDFVDSMTFKMQEVYET